LQPYYLLPFKFDRIDNNELIVNELGDYLLVLNGIVEKIVQKRVSKTDDFNLYADLIANHFISELPIPLSLDIMSIRYRTKKSFLDHFTGLHIIIPTLRCNQYCHYCQVSHVAKENIGFDMDYNTIDNMLNLIFKSPNPAITLEFQGGEPLLALDKIKYIIEKAFELNLGSAKKITSVICTNLTLLTDDVMTFCKANEILISTSLDGPEHLHNFNRYNPSVDSYKTAIDNIKKCREVLGKDRVSALMTTSKLSLNYPVEIIDEYILQGFNEIFLRIINPFGHALKNNASDYSVDDFFEFYKKALDYILELNRRGVFFVESFTKLILSKMLSPFPIGFVDLQSPSGVINNVIVYNYNGNVYPSDEARMIAEMGDEFFKLGNVNQNNYNDIFYGKKAKSISENWSNECLSGCSECAFQSYCGADPIRNYSIQGDMYGFRPTSDFCRKNKLIFKHLIQLIESDREIEEIFNNWISFP